MKRGVGILLALIIGSLLGFFGVFVSIFSDGDLSERIIIIGIILLVYCILNAVWGFFLPAFSWIWGLIFGIPATLLLIIYYISEPNSLYLIYIILILVLSCLSAIAGSKIKTGKRK